MGKVVPLLVVVAALAGGAAAGHVLRPAPAEPPAEEAPVDAAAAQPEPLAQPSTIALDAPFIVPVLRDGQTWSHVVLTLGVVSAVATGEDIARREPLLRDGFMEALFLHGSLGGFDRDFTDPQAMTRLRRRLDAMAAERLGDPDARVLIVSMARQAA